MNGRDEGTGGQSKLAQNNPIEGRAESINLADGRTECINPTERRAGTRRLRWTGKEYALLEEDPCMYGWRGFLQRKAAGITDTDPEAMYRDKGDGYVWFGACRMRAEEAAAIPDVDDSVPDELDPAWTGYMADL